VEQYYAECYGANGRLLPGAELKAALCRIVNTGTLTNSYGTNLDSILTTLDACPTNESMVQCIYLQRGIVLFNKEHLWVQNHGAGSTPAYVDLHHLRPSDMTMNSCRSNRDFDDCRGQSDAQEKYGCWYTKTAFEPPDSAKGDIARAMLYMDVRYESDSTPTGDLELVDKVGTSMYGNEMGRLSTLLAWNELDPVDEFEKRRNELIYRGYQGNRNPFVDHPEWARRIFAPGSGSNRDRVNVSVSGLDARQRYPWNGLVDIDYEVSLPGGGEEERAWVEVSGMDAGTGEAIGMRTLGGMGAADPVPAGKYRMTWDMGVDAPHLVSDAFSVKMRAGTAAAAYWVMDMGSGACAEQWPIETWEGVPVGGWDLENKTAKLVLRRVEAGTFTMGSPDGELGRQGDETAHAVTLEQPYGLGVFPVTQKQWALATGGEVPSQYAGDARPVECVSQGMVRGLTDGTQWPLEGGVDADSFLGVLRAKTGVAFDLPTEAQWEHACRAGTGTALNSGKELTGPETCDNLAELGRYAHNGGSEDTADGRHAEVGSYAPNAWGLYDMHGNVWEWCLDWYGEGGTDAPATNPVGPETGTGRVVRGGSWNSDAQDCRSARRGVRNPSEAAADIGLRVACPMDSAHVQRMSFEPIGTQIVTGRVALAATASGGGDVVFSVVSGPGELDGKELRFSGTGEVVVRARQPGDANRWPVNAEQCVTVIRAQQSMAFAAIETRETTDEVVLEATATGGGPVVFSVVSGPAEVNGNVLSFTGEGTVVVRATQEGDDTWAPVSATQSVRVVASGRLHSVSIADGILHGTVTADVGRAARGDTVTLIVMPEDGWKLARLTLNGEVIYGASFTMPDRDAVVSAEFTEREMSVYWPVETEKDFELGAFYLVVAQLPGIYTSALRNGIKASRIGVEEVEIGQDGAIRSDSDSIVWQIFPGKTEGTATLYNEEAHVYAASSTADEHYSQLLENDTSELTQWWLDFTNLPEVWIHSLYYPDPWDSFSRNYEPLNDYFANYHNYCVRPRLYKKVRDGELKVRFDKADGFSVNLGQTESITVSARNGTEPYAFIWTSDTSALNGLGPTLPLPGSLASGHYAVQVVATDASSRQAAKTIEFTVGASRVQDFDAWGRHDSFDALSPDWSVDSGKTILNAEMHGGVMISRYIESVGNTKAIELFNGGVVDISFKDTPYYLQQYDNGATLPSISIALTNGGIPAGSTFAITRTLSATNYPPDPALRLFGTIQGNPSRLLRTDALTFNGDDAIVLRKGTASGRVVDRVGQVSETAPGSPWRRLATDHTLVRKGTVHNGNTNDVTDAFILSEWTVLDGGEFGNLGEHMLLDPDADRLPSGYSLLLDTGASLTTPVLKGGIGDISFFARPQGAATGDDLVLAIESAPDGNSSSWVREATITIPLSRPAFARYECRATNTTHTAVRFRHLADGTTNRIRLDDISVEPAYTLKRSECFFTWTNAIYKKSGLYARAQWTLCGRITTNGIAGPLAASLPVDSGYLRTPVFPDGVGQISFALCRPSINDTVQVAIETSEDGGNTWTAFQTFSYLASKKGTFTNVSAWVFIPSNGCARIVCNGGTADAIVDNVSVGVPTIVRALDFDDFMVNSSYVSYYYKGWAIADTAINNSANAFSGNSGLLRNGAISSPRIDSMGSIAFMFRMGVSSGDDKARLKVEVSSDGKIWSVLASSLPGTADWQSYAYWFGASNDWHYVRITQTSSSRRMFIDDIAINDFSPGPSVAFDKPDGFTVELGQTDHIFASASNGTEPYRYVWFSDTPGLNGAEGPVLEIPATLAAGDYTVVAEVSDEDGLKGGKAIHFSVVGESGEESIASTRRKHLANLGATPAKMDDSAPRNHGALGKAEKSKSGGTRRINSHSVPGNGCGATADVPNMPRHSSGTASLTLLDSWSGRTTPFRVDARAGSGEALEVRDAEWVAWDTAWVDGGSRTEVTLEHPDGTRETLGGAEGKGAHGSAEWTPGEDEWGTFTLRLASWDAEGDPLEELLALRIRRRPVESYAAWIETRGGTPETMPMESDSDSDGATNWEEYVADTDPLDPDETFASRLEVLEDGTLRVIPSVVSTGRLYRVRLHDDLLQDAIWRDLGPGRPGIGAELGGETGQTGFGAVGVFLP
jgi:formylglycine-generating enzyme required for sulfatase activity/endonuclease I